MIIPAYRSDATLPRTLQTLESAAAGLDVETVVVRDDEGRGPSWARNRGLERATGDLVFFCDADDAVRPGFFRRPLEAMERTGAEMCLFGFNDVLPRRDYDLSGADEVRRVFLPTVFGYSFDDVRRWNRGGRLWDSREWAMVWRAAFRRDFLERHRLRFDERVRFCEDAMFLSACAARCARMCSVAASLYDYAARSDGLLARGARSEARWAYKFQMLDFRRRLDQAFGVWRLCEASVVFSALELFRARRGFFRYARAPRVAEAFAGFPTSVRHPLVAAGVRLCGLLARGPSSSSPSSERRS